MNVALAEIGAYILYKEFLHRPESEDESAEDRSIRQMVNCLAEHHGTVSVPALTYGEVFPALDGVIERNRHWFSIPDQRVLLVGLSAIKSKAGEKRRRSLDR